MGVYIKGMEIPKSRGEYDLRLYVDSDGTATVEGSYCRFEGEPFEAVPVPPHGGLIDADYLNMEYAETNEDGEWVILCDALCEVPVIIPAEEGET